MRCFDIARWRTQWHVPVLMTPPARLPVKPSTVFLPIPAAASVPIGGAAIGIGVASAVGAASRPPAPSSVEPFASSAMEVRHELAAPVVVASNTGSAAPMARRLRRRLLRRSGSPLRVMSASVFPANYLTCSGSKTRQPWKH